MLITPPVHRRPIERFKSNRSLSVQKTERSKRLERHEKPPTEERRLVKDRRKKNLPFSKERRRHDRRLAHFSAKPEVKAMLDNSGKFNKTREGRFINETV